MFSYFLFPLLAIIISWRFGSALILACYATFFLWIGVTTGDLGTISGIAPFRCLAGFVTGMMFYRQRNIFLMMSDAARNVCQASAVIAIVAMLMVPVNDSLKILPIALRFIILFLRRNLRDPASLERIKPLRITL